jgi:hypothetical protein
MVFKQKGATDKDLEAGFFRAYIGPSIIISACPASIMLVSAFQRCDNLRFIHVVRKNVVMAEAIQRFTIGIFSELRNLHRYDVFKISFP